MSEDNPLVKAYCDGAAMAYRDMAQKLRAMAQDCPAELRPYMEAMLPLADSCEAKARNVHNEAHLFLTGERQ